MIDNSIKIIVGNVFSKIIVPAGSESYYFPLLQKIDEALSFDIPGKEHVSMYNTMNKETGERLWDGKKHLFNLTGRPLKKIAWKRYITEPWFFPTGNIRRVMLVMSQYNVLPKLESTIDYNLEEENKYEYQWNEKYIIRDYQERCIQEALKYKRGILQIATGGGKTLISAKIINKLKMRPVVFFVTTKDLLYQAYNTFKDALLEDDIGIIGDGKCIINNINVMTIQTSMKSIGKYNEFSKYLKEFSQNTGDDLSIDDEEEELTEDKLQKINELLKTSKVILFDECQHAPADSCREVLMECHNATHKYGLSATPFRDDGEDLTIEGLFGNNLINISSSFLISNNFLIKPRIFMINVASKPQSKSYQNEYSEAIVRNNERNLLISSIANSFQKKEKTVLILVKYISHGEILKKYIPNSVFIDGTKSTKKRQHAINGIKDRSIKIVIATTLADEGLDIPSLDVLILAGSGKSRTKALQRIGRVIRTSQDKTEAFVFDFLDNSKYCKKHSLMRRRIYKSEPSFLLEEYSFEDFLNNKNIKNSYNEILEVNNLNNAINMGTVL